MLKESDYFIKIFFRKPGIYSPSIQITIKGNDTVCILLQSVQSISMRTISFNI